MSGVVILVLILLLVIILIRNIRIVQQAKAYVVERLGGGAYGDVFRIRTDSYGVSVESALKVIQFSYETETVSLLSVGQEDLRNEILIMEDLRGAPNIVTIEDFYVKRDGSACSLFMRMELLTSFQELMLKHEEDSRIFTPYEVIKIGRDICTALMYCEKKGIIHRDIIKHTDGFVFKNTYTV